jgi:hypothetical protein
MIRRNLLSSRLQSSALRGSMQPAEFVTLAEALA